MIAEIRYSEGVQEGWNRFATFIPKFIGFLAILFIGYIVAKAIAKIADAVLERVGFDRAVERGGVKKALAASKYDASDLVSKIIFYGLFLIVLQMAFGVFGTNPVSDLLRGIVAYLPKVLAAIIIVVIASAIGAAVKELITAALGGLSYGKALATAAAAAIITVGVFAALDQLQIAPAIVTGLFYAILAIIVGSAVISIGGGGIRPMQSRWERTLARYDEERPKVQQTMQGAGNRVAQRADQLKDKAKSATASDSQVSSYRTDV